MISSFNLLPQRGGYLVSVFPESREQVFWSIDLSLRIQNEHWPKLPNGHVRLRFPKELFTREMVNFLAREICDSLIDEINISRQRKHRKSVIAAIVGPIELPKVNDGLFGEWVLILENIGWSLGHSIDLAKNLARCLAPAICELLFKETKAQSQKQLF